MNNLDVIYEKTINIDSLKYGLSPLHAYMRFYECLLHIAHRLDIKKWRVSTGLERQAYEKKKKEIQHKLREQLGLIADVPISGGRGTSNDGNSARIFFEKYGIS